MAVKFGLRGLVGGICGLMVEQVHAVHKFGRLSKIHRIRAVGVALARIGVRCEHLVGYHFPFGGHIVGSLLDGFHLRHRHLVKSHHIPTDVTRLRLFAKQKSHIVHPVAQRKRFHRQAAAVEQQLPLRRVYDVEFQLIRPLAAEKVDHLAQYFRPFGKGVHRHSAPHIV